MEIVRVYALETPFSGSRVPSLLLALFLLVACPLLFLSETHRVDTFLHKRPPHTQTNTQHAKSLLRGAFSFARAPSFTLGHGLLSFLLFPPVLACFLSLQDEVAAAAATAGMTEEAEVEAVAEEMTEEVAVVMIAVEVSCPITNGMPS